jgi:hypothetical protein
MAGSNFDSFEKYIADTIYSGQTARLMLCNSATWGRAAGMADILATELAQINGYTRSSVALSTSTYNTGNQRAEVPQANFSFAASGSALSWNALVGILGGSATANKVITAVDAGTDTFTCANHGLSADDLIMVTVDAGGTIPAGVSATTLYYAVVASSNTFQLSTTSGGGSIVNVTSAGSGTIRLRYGNGRLVGFYSAGSTQQIPDGGQLNVPTNIIQANIGYVSGV